MPEPRDHGSQGCPPHVEAWSKRLGHGTQPALPRCPRHRHAHRTLPATHRPDRRGRLHEGPGRFAEPIVAGSVRELPASAMTATRPPPWNCRRRSTVWPGGGSSGARLSWSRTARSRPSRSCSTSAEGKLPCAIRRRSPAGRPFASEPEGGHQPRRGSARHAQRLAASPSSRWRSIRPQDLAPFPAGAYR